MKEHGILFGAPMVRALLNGTKTQTRRPLYTQTSRVLASALYNRVHADGFQQPCLPPIQQDLNGPYWTVSKWAKVQRGDRLWGRETWMPDPPRDGTWPSTSYDGCKPRDMSLIPDRFRTPEHCIYRATWEGPELHGWTPAIHMFRWASRIIREVTQLRVEKLQEISEADAIAEGIQRYAGPLRWVRYLDAITGEATHSSARDAYFSLWEALHGPGSVDADPWLCALSFKEVP